MKLLFLLLIVPLTELYIMIEVGTEIGALNVILLILASAMLGGIFMRQQGLATLQRAQQELAAGQVPEVEMLEGIFIFIGGLFLLLPGFITDSLGLLLLIPFIRHSLVKRFIKQRQANFRSRGGNVYEAEWSETASPETIKVVGLKAGSFSRPGASRHSSNDDIIEGEEIEPKK